MTRRKKHVLQHQQVQMKTTYSSALLSYSTATVLGILQIISAVSNQPSEIPSVNQLLEEYKDLFQGNGKLKDLQVKLHIDESVKPAVQPHRRIPFHIRKKVE